MDASQRARAALAIELEVALSRPEWGAEVAVCKGNARTLYWSVSQQIAHHTVTGCNLRPGDLLATGTVSGPALESAGCLLERTWRGERPLHMPDGSTRAFLLDGDTVTMRAMAAGPGGARIGFGECVGTVLPAHAE
jgi:fumarylacetoacetase